MDTEEKLNFKEQNEPKQNPNIQNLVTEKANSKRERIDRLLLKKDIRYRGIFSHKIVKALGFVFLFFAQLAACLFVIAHFSKIPEQTNEAARVLLSLSMFALPLFLTSSFCVIMISQEKIKKTLLIYSATAIGIYLLVLFVFYRYLFGIGKVLCSGDTAEAYKFAEDIANAVFGKIVNYNVFVDLSLFSLFYFFLFYNPKKIITKKGIIAFRSMSCIPVLAAITASVLYALYNTGVLYLPVAILAILPCRSILVYVIFFALALVIKLRQVLFVKWGGTKEEYAKYFNSNKSSLEMSIIASAIIVVVCSFDLLLSFLIPKYVFFAGNFNYYFALSIPFIFLFSYTRKIKKNFWDVLMLAVFVFAVIILYLETGLYIFKHLG